MGLFDQTLDGLIRSLRNMKTDDLSYISQCIDKIKEEIRHGNISAKTNAVAKLIYLQMHGWDSSWAAFHVIEVMSSMKFTFKRIGYLAASQSFHENLEVLILATNTLKKDINSQNMYESGAAMSSLSNFVTPSIAKYLSNDLLTLTNSTKPYLRKRATLLMYHICLHVENAKEAVMSRLMERLGDSDPGVQLAAVNVVCELAREDPKRYLYLAPVLYNLMKNVPNNWMLIRIIKLFCSFILVEPRLSKKLTGCLTALIHSTTAMSLLYECLNTVLVSVDDRFVYNNVTKLCVERLRVFIESPDKNLKYLGLLTMSKILKNHHNSVVIHRDLVLECLEDRDHSIKHRALDLLQGMVCRKNLRYVVERLILHMEKSPGAIYRDLVIDKIIEVCSQSNYAHMTKFEWYICILIDFTKTKGTKRGDIISDQLIDICLRFQNVRNFAVSKMSMLVENGDFLYQQSARTNIYEVLRAVFWICGEYAEMLQEPKRTLEIMLNSNAIDLPSNIQILYAQSVFKIYACVARSAENDNDFSLVTDITKNVNKKLQIFVESDDLEVQERISCIMNILKFIIEYLSKNVKISDGLLFFRDEKIPPVDQDAQNRVPIPDGLDLDLRINETMPERLTKTGDKETVSEVFTMQQEPQKGIKQKKKLKKKAKKSGKRHCSEEITRPVEIEPLLLFEEQTGGT